MTAFPSGFVSLSFNPLLNRAGRLDPRWRAAHTCGPLIFKGQGFFMAKAKSKKASKKAKTANATGRSSGSNPSAAAAGGHSFGRPRPGADGTFALHLDADRNTSFRPLPP